MRLLPGWLTRDAAKLRESERPAVPTFLREQLGRGLDGKTEEHRRLNLCLEVIEHVKEVVCFRTCLYGGSS